MEVIAFIQLNRQVLVACLHKLAMVEELLTLEEELLLEEVLQLQEPLLFSQLLQQFLSQFSCG